MNRLMSIKRIAAAVLPMDYFSGTQAMLGSVHVMMEDGGACIKKADGYVVFWDNGEDKRTVILESPYYERETVQLDMEQFRKKKIPSLYIWLKPSAAYPYPLGMRLAVGEVKPNAVADIPMEGSAGVIQLHGAYPMDRMYPRQIRLTVPENIEIEGRTLLIRRLSDNQEELFTIWDVRNKSMGLYELEHPLEEVYSIYDTEILMILQIKSDCKGLYRIPMMQGSERGDG